MEKLLYLLLLPLIFSCGGKSSENPDSRNILENLTYTVEKTGAPYRLNPPHETSKSKASPNLGFDPLLR